MWIWVLLTITDQCHVTPHVPEWHQWAHVLLQPGIRQRGLAPMDLILGSAPCGTLTKQLNTNSLSSGPLAAWC